jgi:hypothetical protein
MKSDNLWPELQYDNWKDSLDALHMKMQVAGKVKLALSPFLNHWWNIAFHLNASGLTTGLMSSGNIIFDINFDLKLHKCKVVTSDNLVMQIPFMQCSVAEFFRELMSFLGELGIKLRLIHCLRNTGPGALLQKTTEELTIKTTFTDGGEYCYVLT